MSQSKIRILILVALIIGFAGGFVLRPVVMPAITSATLAASPPSAQALEARSTEYFSAHLEEARLVVAGCRDGSIRGNECANADAAIIAAESKDRFRRFRDK